MKKKQNIDNDLKEKIRKLELENAKLKMKLPSSKTDGNYDVPYQTLIESSKDGIAIVQDSEIKYANNGLLNIIGYTLNEMVGTQFLNFVHDDDKQRVLEYHNKRLIGEDAPPNYEFRLTKKTGEIVFIEINVSIIALMEQPAVIAAIRDVTDKVKAREVIRKHETELSFILEVINDGYWDWDVNSGTLRFNKNFKYITGHDILQIQIPNLDELVFLPPKYKNRFMQIAAEFLTAGRTTFAEEFQVSKPDGSIGWVIVKGRIYEKDDNGIPLRIMGTFTDVTSLKLAEEKQRENLAFVNTLMNTIQNPVFYKNTRGLYEGCNLAFSEFTGIPIHKLIKSSVYDLYDKDLADMYFNADSELFNLREKQVYETKMRRADGSIRDVIFYKDVYYNQKGELAGLIGVIFDNTERKKIAEELEKKNQFLESILKKLPVVLFSINNEGIFTLSEGLGLSAMGLKSGQAVGMSIRHLYKDQPVIIESISKALKGEMSIDRGHYNGHYFETYYSPLIGDDKKIEGIIGINLDVTKKENAQKEIEKYLIELQESKEQLEKYSRELIEKNEELEKSEKSLLELNATKDKFFSIVSHDLRSPFMSLLGLADLLSTDYGSMDHEAIQESLASLNRNAKNIYSLLENLLEWAKMQMGRHEIIPREVNLLEAVHTVIDIFKVSIDDKKIEVAIDIEKKLKLFVDADVLHTVLRNIISNSLKFSSEKGVLSILASCSNEFCKIVLSDSGIGMDRETLGKLFGIDQLKTKPGLMGEKGSGLGLILTKELVEASGGQIKVESEVGKGTTFTITLPML